ncbi:MAG: hypothetical protein A2259_03570 [Candidatus Moranbacteria bacterium RIFOXYA2_FULL_43_15]|nr:MAG: hypothetical protein A2259_03570 [Candidatus Moranbacteria bacterium RIFOXYA2_FULL_43_15]
MWIFEFAKKRKKILIALAIFVVLCVTAVFLVGGDKKTIGIKSLSVLNKVSNLLPIPADEKKELEVINKLVQEFTKKDDVERSFMIFLQNNMELRPGGGFLGQYAIIKTKNGEVTSTFLEDANLLDQRITAKISPPYPFKRMMQIKKWKFRDSNFSPDFPTNVDKAKYFYRLSGRSGEFDGFVAVNSDVFNHVLELTGPITVSGHTFTGENGALKLEEVVEKAYIMNPELDTQNRKAIMRQMAPLIVDGLFSLGNISKIADFVHKEFKNRNIMVNFTDSRLQAAVEEAHWDGKMAADWGGDYLMMVDANMGSLKTDYYIKREVAYDINLTGEKPVATLNILYKNTAPYGDWRTSDYHSYLRIYIPKGSNLLDRKMVSYPNVGEEFGKTYMGFTCHVVMGTQTAAMIKYELPADFNRDDYRLLIQKQSGVGNIPVKVHLKTKDGEFNQEQVLNNDLKFEFRNNE